MKNKKKYSTLTIEAEKHKKFKISAQKLGLNYKNAGEVALKLLAVLAENKQLFILAEITKSDPYIII